MGFYDGNNSSPNDYGYGGQNFDGQSNFENFGGQSNYGGQNMQENFYEQQSQFSDFTGGFDGGNPVQYSGHGIGAAIYEDVISKAFLFMVVALLITAFAAYTATGPMLPWLVQGNHLFLVFGAEVAIVLISNFAIRKNNAILLGILFTAYSYLTGATLGIILLLYTASSVASVFVITAVLFAIMAVYGTVTKKDLSSIGSICLMGLIGIILVGLVNIFFLRSDMVDMAIAAVGVLIFVGLTAYDTQKIKQSVMYADSSNVLTLALAGAFELYLDFINLFLKLLRLLGKRK